MRTIEQIIEAIKGKTIEPCFPDGRNVTRLLPFIPLDQWDALGYEPREGADMSNHPAAFTEEAVMDKLRGDLEFAFEKARGERGISTAAMFEVIRAWMYVLGDDELFAIDDYTKYALPYYERVADKYSLAVA